MLFDTILFVKTCMKIKGTLLLSDLKNDLSIIYFFRVRLLFTQLMKNDVKDRDLILSFALIVGLFGEVLLTLVCLCCSRHYLLLALI